MHTGSYLSVIHFLQTSFFFSYAFWADFDDSSFGRKWNKLRFFMCKVVENKAFEYFILVCIALSSMSLVSMFFILFRKIGVEIDAEFSR